ncbi:hypothetical protein GR160_00300 [Flavobacterium sp. Sd200]|uniref:hypothetical protein n=1 Tax=Flavobacterium sp. Sd200 TaxID=2692211 RepID=UPI001369C953|nr:hypothetical protein [Flavobacterium sp. Sd200]MXN89655.1 hypothetical protein [Flavobacterium sp. Sd200]
MQGTWKGYYRYEKETIRDIVGFEQTNYTITITSFNGKNFEGIVNDDIETGGMEGTGKIIGTLIDNKITFEKFMPKASVIINTDGELKKTNKKHKTLYYSGKISDTKKEIMGTWRFNLSLILLFGFIPIIYRPGKGTWSMKLTDSES